MKQDVPMYFPIMHMSEKIYIYTYKYYIHICMFTVCLPSVSLNPGYHGLYCQYVSLKNTAYLTMKSHRLTHPDFNKVKLRRLIKMCPKIYEIGAV